MTPEENDLLCRVEGDAPMGQTHAPPLDRRLPVRRGRRAGRHAGARAAARRRPRRVPRQRRPARRARRILPASPRLAALRRATRNAGCAASITAGSWTWKATCVEMASEPPESGFAEKVKHKAYPAREAGGFVWTYMGPADEMPEFEPPAFAPTPDAQRQRSSKVHVRCNWAQILEGQIDSAHSLEPAFVRHGAGAGRRREGDRHALAAALDRQGAALPGRAHQLRLPLRGDPPADQERGDARLHPHHGLRRAVHRADPAEQRVQRRDRADARRTTHTRSFYFIAWNGADKPGIDAGSVAQVQRARNGASISTRTSTTSARARTTTCRTATR